MGRARRSNHTASWLPHPASRFLLSALPIFLLTPTSLPAATDQVWDLSGRACIHQTRQACPPDALTCLAIDSTVRGSSHVACTHR